MLQPRSRDKPWLCHFSLQVRASLPGEALLTIRTGQVQEYALQTPCSLIPSYSSGTWERKPSICSAVLAFSRQTREWVTAKRIRGHNNTALCAVHLVFQLLRTHRHGALYSSPAPGWLWVPLHYAVAKQKYSLCYPFTNTALLQTDQAPCCNKEKWNRMFLLEFIPLLKVLKESMKANLIFKSKF